MYERKCKTLRGLYMKCRSCHSSPVRPYFSSDSPGVGDFWYSGHGTRLVCVLYLLLPRPKVISTLYMYVTYIICSRTFFVVMCCLCLLHCSRTRIQRTQTKILVIWPALKPRRHFFPHPYEVKQVRNACTT